MPHARWMLVVAVMVVMGSLPGEAWSQVRASEPATVSQTVDGTVLTVEYSRPRVRGRSPIYGKEVVWGEVWTPGANWATTLEVSSDVTIDGHALPKGKYSVWMEVQEGDWTVILDPNAKQFHTAHPKPDSSQIRFSVTPDSIAGPEVLLWSFPEISTSGMVLQVAWAGRAVRLPIIVPPSRMRTLAADLAPRYVGSYSLRWIPRDTTSANADSAPPPLETWQISYVGDTLMLNWEVPDDDEAEPYHALLVSVGGDAFFPGFIEENDYYEEVPGLLAEFSVTDGRATGFVIRRKDDTVQAVGTRMP